jgi:hypothetical protein
VDEQDTDHDVQAGNDGELAGLAGAFFVLREMHGVLLVVRPELISQACFTA